MTWGYIGGAAVSVIGGALLKDDPKPSGQSGQAQLDPRIANILFGTGRVLKPGATPTEINESGVPVYDEGDYTNDSGLLGRYQGLFDKKQNQGLANYGQAADNYLGTNSAWDMGEARDSAFRLMKNAYDPVSMQAAQGAYTMPMNAAFSQMPQAYQAATSALAQAGPAALINTPGQNNLGLGRAFQDVIYGDLGNNPYLAGAIQKGLNQSSAQFQNLQNDTMQQFKEDILPSLRGDAITNGQYGGSRQGIAEGKAADSLARNMSRALSQVGQNMTDAAVAAQSGQYSQDRQNQLNAAMGLSGQQYNVAGQDAGAKNQVNLSNAQMANNNNQFNATAQNNVLSQLFGGALQTNLANAGFLQQANQNNYQGMQATNMANLGNRQQANMQNAAWQLANNQLNSQNKLNGLNAVTSLINNAYGVANNQNDYALNQARRLNGLLSPYMGISGPSSSNGASAKYGQGDGMGSNLLGGFVKGIGNVFSGQGAGKAGNNSSNPVWSNSSGDAGSSDYPIWESGEIV
ncbi:MAG: hypothetical protein HYR68_13965 [Burkholderiales bacterium]|nr:hypothetical protein [Burkholderiales bacterium]